MKIIKQRELIESTTYVRAFEYEDSPGSGFSFDCDEKGNVVSLNPCSRKNYEACVSGSMDIIRGQEYRPIGDDGYEPIPGTGTRMTVKIVDMGVVTYRHSYSAPAVGKCACGTHVELDRFTNTCDRCGRDYNMSGQLLAPRSQWGEETGESVSDILAVDGMTTDQLFEE